MCVIVSCFLLYRIWLCDQSFTVAYRLCVWRPWEANKAMKLPFISFVLQPKDEIHRLLRKKILCSVSCITYGFYVHDDTQSSSKCFRYKVKEIKIQGEFLSWGFSTMLTKRGTMNVTRGMVYLDTWSWSRGHGCSFNHYRNHIFILFALR